MIRFAQILFCFIASVYKLYAEDKILRTEDWVYEPTVKTVILYTETGDKDQYFNPPILSLYQNQSLVLEFDELSQNVATLYYKILPCDMNWEPNTNLLESEYLKDFLNDYLITNYIVSFNTRTKYVHYKLQVPKLKLSGNYIIAVYRNDNPYDLLLSRRFIIFENKVNIQPNIKVSIGVEERFTHQQVDFTINYSAYPYIFNPMQEIKVVVRQNYRWDNALDLKPLYVKESERILDYNFFNLENNFPAGKEFRVFDTRKTRTNSMNVDHVEFLPDKIKTYLMQEKPRYDVPYGFTFDINGRFLPANNEVGGNMNDADYTYVIFDLKLRQMPFGSVYVLGGFNEYKTTELNKMHYDPDTDSYKCSIFLKQGYYNYMYGVKGKKENIPDIAAIEGNSVYTENMYEIIVYHRAIGARNDAVIGYYAKSFNGGNTGGF